MNRKLALVLSFIMVFSGVFAVFSTPVFADEHTDEYRIAGENRYLTAYEIAKYNDPNPETVIIARGDGPSGNPNVADGLTASALAGFENAQILLVEKDRIPNSTIAALKSLDPTNAIIVGGESAVAPEVEAELEGLGLNVSRVAGLNRAETAAKVAAHMGEAKDNTAIIVDGRAEPDALVVGPLAFQGHPVLMVNNAQNRIPKSTLDVIDELGIENLIIVGGTNVVSEALEAELEGIDGVTVAARYGGKDRVETSLLLAEIEAFDDFDSISFVNGWRYVDAVAASTLGQPVVYLDLRRDRDWSSPQNAGSLALLQTMRGFKAIGGPVAIPELIVDQAIDQLLKDIVDTAIAADDFNTLVAALVEAELDEALRAEGPFTVFAPTDQAFADLLVALDLTVEELLALENLSDILLYHVVADSVLSSDLSDGQEVETLQGDTVTITIDTDGNVFVNDAQVIIPDIECSNGVIHAIDAVLLPPE